MKAVASQVAQWVKNPPASAGCGGDAGLILGLGRSPGERHGNPLQYSCLENPTDRGAWQATVHGSQRATHDWSDLARTDVRVGPPRWDQCPPKKKQTSSLPLSLTACEDTARQRLNESQEEGPLRAPSLLAPWFWMSSLQNCEKWMSMVFCYNTLRWDTTLAILMLLF